MKFISRNKNLRLVLKHGIPAEPITGRLAVSGLYVKFENGMVTVENPEIVELLKRHPGFNTDFIMAEGPGTDPYAATRSDGEPEHDNIEIQFGHVGKNVNPVKPQFTPEQRKAIIDVAKEMATNMAKEMAVVIAKEALKKMVEEKELKKAPSIIKKSSSKKPSKKAVASVGVIETPHPVEDTEDESKKDVQNEVFKDEVG